MGIFFSQHSSEARGKSETAALSKNTSIPFSGTLEKPSLQLRANTLNLFSIPEMIETIIGLTIAVMLAICIVLASALLREIEKQQPTPQKKQSTRPKNGRQLQQIIAELRKDFPGRDEHWYWDKAERELMIRQTSAPIAPLTTYKPSSKPIEPLPVANSKSTVNQQTTRKLFALTNGDRKLANRLLDKAREYYPGRSEQWVWEKVIWDIERDRRA